LKTSRYLQSVQSSLPEGAQTSFDLAFTGDAMAARRLMNTVPRRFRGHIACLAFETGLENPAYREILRAAWEPETRRLLTDFRQPRIVRGMLARASFQIPEFASPVIVYRRVDCSLRKAAAGLCWSLSRELAASSSALSLKASGRLRILRATLDRPDIIYWGNSRGEQEIVACRPVGAVLDDDDDAVRLAYARRS
jgi:hypothetical protein